MRTRGCTAVATDGPCSTRAYGRGCNLQLAVQWFVDAVRIYMLTDMIAAIACGPVQHSNDRSDTNRSVIPPLIGSVRHINNSAQRRVTGANENRNSCM